MIGLVGKGCLYSFRPGKAAFGEQTVLLQNNHLALAPLYSLVVNISLDIAEPGWEVMRIWLRLVPGRSHLAAVVLPIGCLLGAAYQICWYWVVMIWCYYTHRLEVLDARGED